MNLELVAVAAAAATSAAATSAPAPPAVTVAARRPVLAGSLRRVLRPLDQLLGLDERLVLVLRHELEPDPATLLVDLLNDHVQHVAAVDHVLDVPNPARADVG